MITKIKTFIIATINISQSCLANLTFVIRITITFSAILIRIHLTFTSFSASSSLFPVIAAPLFSKHSFINLIFDSTVTLLIPSILLFLYLFNRIAALISYIPTN